MKILHVLKTSSGGDWAARQVTELTRRGVEVHVIVPSSHGSTMELWKNSGAQMHFANLDFPVRAPWKLWKRLKTARALVAQIQPQIIHSHFVGTTLTLRLALGKKHPIPRFFQVPGPLHMENSFFRRMEIATAGPADFWLASSRY
ncbi:MAG: glycosyltransferase family 1 protein, partial [Bdellovibrio sp. CG10_big_fil_rev_8_21_14_0_10_47_8]